MIRRAGGAEPEEPRISLCQLDTGGYDPGRSVALRAPPYGPIPCARRGARCLL